MSSSDVQSSLVEDNAAIAAARPAGPLRARVMQVVTSGGIDYFVDVDAQRFRQVQNPRLYVAFASEEGRGILQRCVTLDCPHCETPEIVWRTTLFHAAKCRHCGG